MASTLCERCRRVQDLDFLLDDQPLNSKGYSIYNQTLQVFSLDDHWPELPELAKSASSSSSSGGCALCKLLREKLSSAKARVPERQHAAQDVQVRFHRTASRKDVRPRIIYSYEAMVCSKEKFSDGTVDIVSAFFLACSSMPELPFHRAPSKEVFSQQTIDFAKQAIDHCTSTCHPDTASTTTTTTTTSGFTPTRLLDLKDSTTTGTIRLVLLTAAADKPCPKYAALSYCWGNAADAARQSTTTSANQAERMRGSALHDLCPVVRDAVAVCAKLNIRYLWIDALCILQGKQDRHDWEAESVRMVDIYRHAFLTLCIAATTSCQQSFLAPREMDAGTFIPLPPQANAAAEAAEAAEASSPRGYQIIPFHDISHATSPGYFSRLITDSQWFSRGWVWQEMNFSTRLLIFAQGLLFYECADAQRCENGATLQYGGKAIVRVGSPSADVLRDEPFRFFQMGVTVFAAKALSFETDRLVAIAGLAKEIARRTGCSGDDGEYLAGLWAKNLCKDLLFRRKSRGEAGERLALLRQDDHHHHAAAAGHSGPSWAWPAHPGGVEWASDLWFSSLMKCEDTWRLECSKESLDIKTVLAGSNPFGQVVSGVMKMHTKASSLSDLAVWIRDEFVLLNDADRDRDTLIVKMLHAYSSELTRLASFAFFWDTTNPELDVGQPKKLAELADDIFLVLTSSCNFPRSVERDAYGLLVQRAPSRGGFVRVGVFHSEAPSNRYKKGYIGGLPVIQKWKTMDISIV